MSDDAVGVRLAIDPLCTQNPQHAQTVGEVVATMRRIDASLTPADGLKWFNLLYLTVTETVQEELNTQQWSDLALLQRLDIVFANLYFAALASWVSVPDRTPRAWRPLLQARQDRRPFRLQFALAGMNAHINRDLCVALLQITESLREFPGNDSGMHQDFMRVNEILQRAEKKAVTFLSTGLVGLVDQALGDVDDILAMWSVRRAREAAWINAEVLWHLRPFPALGDQYLDRLDRTAGFASRGLLQPVASPLATAAVSANLQQ